MAEGQPQQLIDPSSDEFFVWRTMRVYTGTASDPEIYGLTADDDIDETWVEQAVLAGIGVEREKYHFKTIAETTKAVINMLQNKAIRQELFEEAKRSRNVSD